MAFKIFAYAYIGATLGAAVAFGINALARAEPEPAPRFACVYGAHGAAYCYEYLHIASPDRLARH